MGWWGRATQVVGIKKGSFSFRVFSAVKNENKESSTVWKLNPCWVCLSLRLEKLYLCSIFTESASSFCLRTATEDSILYPFSCCVFNPWSCCLFIIRPPYCEDAASIFTVSTTQSRSCHQNDSTCWIRHTQPHLKNHFIWFLNLLTDLYILFLFNNIRQLLESKQTLSLIYYFLSLPLCRQQKGVNSTQEPFKGNKISLSNHKRCESSPQKFIEPLIN